MIRHEIARSVKEAANRAREVTVMLKLVTGDIY